MTKNETYQAVTDRIIEALEQGTVPWRRPWSEFGGPRNLNGRPYRGINVFLLELAGYDDPRWGTYKAIKTAGGQVRKGEKGTRVILWKPVRKKEEDENGEEAEVGYLLLRDYVVFNAEQADGLPELEIAERDWDPNDRAQSVIDRYIADGGPTLSYGGDRAYYNLFDDSVKLPVLEAFDDGDAYYSTAFHELVHSTGHESRLDRIEPAKFGSEPYGKEELVAEMGAAMLNGLTGISTAEENSAAYIASWLRTIKGDPTLVVNAAAKAQKAADLIVGETFAPEPVEEQQAVAA
jgi:antirestriction protein ArdC